MGYELTNQVMGDRARIGLPLWVCRYLHKGHHREIFRSYDDHWEITSKKMKCGKCGRLWTDLSPLVNLFQKLLVESIGPAIAEQMTKEDPIYKLMKGNER